ncbi:IreB family regulatory phosphoprotein [Gemella sp. GH3]|uniref:IreB family regulatory phosphoprotein n=1 Tax=unclassified Gemella TaxID=2624949 RepID=UPI0015CFA896|nr:MULTISPECIES: IreB family regulatory phosphoprotein [unclassified Gemella]MBF0713212.1 IreB family regulatory phosphoprotein [Gemella sp. GH3.1]NYS50164.1 IreB family regulatory phosphoprotein [Gemella sp. GH3]
MTKFDNTDIFNKAEYNREFIKLTLDNVIDIIESKGYDPVSQLMGYIKTENPVYIPRYNGAREKIIKIPTEDLLEYLIHYFVNNRNFD